MQATYDWVRLALAIYLVHPGVRNSQAGCCWVVSRPLTFHQGQAFVTGGRLLPRVAAQLSRRKSPFRSPPTLLAPPQEVLVNVAPKKANWDLRRDIADKLARLERRTQAAMVRLMQQEEAARLAEEGGQQD